MQLWDYPREESHDWENALVGGYPWRPPRWIKPGSANMKVLAV